MQRKLQLAVAAAFALVIFQSTASSQEIYTSRFRGNVSNSWHENENWDSRYGDYVPVANILNESALIRDGHSVHVNRRVPDIVGLTISKGQLSIRPDGELVIRERALIGSLGHLLIEGRVDAQNVFSFGRFQIDDSAELNVAEDFASTGTLAFDLSQPGGASLQVGGGVTVSGNIEVATDYPIEINDQIVLFEATEFQDLGTSITTSSTEPGIALKLDYENGKVVADVLGLPYLEVAQATGQASIRFPQGDEVAMNGYTITSATGDLRTSEWKSLSLNTDGWLTANPNSNRISELNPLGDFSLNAGTTLDLGTILPAMAESEAIELQWQFSSASGEVFVGDVHYVDEATDIILGGDCNLDGLLNVEDANCTPASELTSFLDNAGLIAGDANGDSRVDFTDFLIFSTNFPNSGDYTEGDFDGSGLIGFADFLILSENFGMSTNDAAGEPVVSVPEPTFPAIWAPLIVLALMAKRAQRLLPMICLGVVLSVNQQATAELFDIRFLHVEPNFPEFEITSVSQATDLLSGKTFGTTVLHDEVGTLGLLDVGASPGRFPGSAPFPVDDFDISWTDYVFQVQGTLEIPAGDWTISFGSDDGGYVRLPGVSFLETTNENGEIIEGDGEIVASRPRPQNWTNGTFTVPSEGQAVSFEGMFYERAGHDVFEVAIRPGHVTDNPRDRPEDWTLLEDGALGWQVLDIANPVDFDGGGSVGFEDFLILAQNFGDFGAQPDGDANHDGIIDLYDFLAFRDEFITTRPVAAAVPEPCTRWILLPAIFVLAACRKKRFTTKLTRSCLLLLVVGTSFLSVQNKATAQSVWLGATDGSWFDESRWNTEIPNRPHESAVIDAAGDPYTVSIPEFVQIWDLTLGPDVMLDVSSTLRIHNELKLQDSLVEFDVLHTANGLASVTGNGTLRARSDKRSTISFGNLTLGPEVVLDTNRLIMSGRALTNRGLIQVGVEEYAGYLRMSPQTFVNAGTIQVAGHFELANDAREDIVWRNDGTIRLKPNSSIAFGQGLRLRDLGTVIDEGAAEVRIGSINNIDQVLDLGTDLPFENLLLGGVRGGTVIAAPDGSQLDMRINQSWEDGVTVKGDISFFESGNFWISNGITLDDASLGFAEGQDVRLGGENPRITGNGEIRITGAEFSSVQFRLSGDELVIEPDVTVRVTSPAPEGGVALDFQENQGTIIVDQPRTTVSLTGENWTNTGQIIVEAGTLRLAGSSTIDQWGSIDIRDRGRVETDGNLDLTGNEIDVDQWGNAWTFSGNITGGSLVAKETEIKLRWATLNDVQLRGPVVVERTVTMTEPLELSDTIKLTEDGRLRVKERIGGSGTIRFDGASNASLAFDDDRGRTGHGEIGEDVVLDVSSPSGRVFFDTLTNNGTIQASGEGTKTSISGNQITNAGKLIVQDQAIIALSANETANHGVIELDDGALVSFVGFSNEADGVITGDGVLRIGEEMIINEGIIGPGELIIQTPIEHRNGAFRFHVTSAEDHSHFFFTTPLTINGGALEITFDEMYQPLVGDEFTLLEANSILGEFELDAPIQFDGTSFDVLYTDHSVRLRVNAGGVAIPEPNSASLAWFAAIVLLLCRNGRGRGLRN